MKNVRMVVSFFFILAVLLCSINADAKKAKYLCKMGSVGPDGVRWATYTKNEFQKTIEKVTNNEVSFDWYWGCIMGDEEDIIAKMNINQLQGGLISFTGTAMVCPEIAVMSLPFMFNNYDEVNYMRKKFGSKFKNFAEKKGYKILIYIHQDFDQFYSTKYKMDTVKDFKQSKFLSYGGKAEALIIKSLGGSPIPINVPEVASATRAGVTNVTIAPAMWWLGAQLYTLTKYVNTVKIRYSPGTMTITLKMWNSIPEKHRKAMIGVFPELEEGFCNECVIGNEKALRAMINYGLTEVKMGKKEIELFKQKTRPVWDKLAGDVYPKEFLDEFVAVLNEYRANKSK